MNRRDFLLGASAAVLAGCATKDGDERPAAGFGGSSALKPSFHVFSKMFQPPVTASPEAFCDLLASSGADGVQWTVRPKGHVEPGRVETDLPRLVNIAKSRGLKCRSICTAITDGNDPVSERIAKTAADCGVEMFRSGYYFYDIKRETFRQSLERIRRGFASLAKLGERCGVKATYQNHSSWGPTLFGGVVWDVHECIRDLDPKCIGLEYDPMHALFETNLSWTHGFNLVAPWIASIDLKDFHYALAPKNSKMMRKSMVAACEGIVPWKEVRRLVEANGVDPLYIVHFEYDFDKSDLRKSVKSEMDAFKSVLA